MFRLWLVARLAVHSRVYALGFHLLNIGVAVCADIVSRKHYRARGDLAERGSAVRPVPPKTLRNHRCPDCHKRHPSQQKNAGHAN